jgi:hypothetical protein
MENETKHIYPLKKEFIDGLTEIFKQSKTITLQNPDGKCFTGVIFEQSIYIPLSCNSESNDYLKTVVQTNLLELGPDSIKNPIGSTCKLLGLPYHGRTKGFISDAAFISNDSVGVLHIFNPDKRFLSQDDFERDVKNMLTVHNLEVSVQ